MSQGPIEFLGEGVVQSVPSTEYGGADGLIQPSVEEVDLKAADGMDIGHVPDASESLQIMARRAMVPLDPITGKTGVEPEPDVVDPATGRELPADMGVSASPDGLRDLLL